MKIILVGSVWNLWICFVHCENIMRGGAVVARWSHNPNVISSSLIPATKLLGIEEYGLSRLHWKQEHVGLNLATQTK